MGIKASISSSPSSTAAATVSAAATKQPHHQYSVLAKRAFCSFSGRGALPKTKITTTISEVD